LVIAIGAAKKHESRVVGIGEKKNKEVQGKREQKSCGLKPNPPKMTPSGSQVIKKEVWSERAVES